MDAKHLRDMSAFIDDFSHRQQTNKGSVAWKKLIDPFLDPQMVL